MAYADTDSDLKPYLDIAADNSDDDTLLASLLANAQAMIDSYCRQTFEASGDTIRYFDAVRDVNGRCLYLDYPLCAITTVTNGDGNTVSSGEYVKEPRNTTPWYVLTLKSSSSVSWTWSTTPENAISITGKWAYSATAPADIKQATVRLAAYLYRQRDNAIDLDRAVQTPSGTILPADLPKDLKTLLAPYRRLV